MYRGDVCDRTAANPPVGTKTPPVRPTRPDCQRLTTDDYESLQFVCILVVTLVVVRGGKRGQQERTGRTFIFHWAALTLPSKAATIVAYWVHRQTWLSEGT